MSRPFGFHHTEKTKEKIRISHIGKKFSESHRKNMSLVRKGKKSYFLGKKHTKESKIKMSIAHKGHIAWNKGLTKEISPLLKSIGKNISKSLKGMFLGDKSVRWKPKIEKICTICKAKFYCKPCLNNIRKTCSNKCRHKYQSLCLEGKNHPNWKGGISLEPYPFNFSKKLKNFIRKRDRYKCQLCGVPKIECVSPLYVHHIDYNKKNISEINLISLCSSCHSKTNYNRKYWEIFFTNLQLSKGVKYATSTN